VEPNSIQSLWRRAKSHENRPGLRTKTHEHDEDDTITLRRPPLPTLVACTYHATPPFPPLSVDTPPKLFTMKLVLSVHTLSILLASVAVDAFSASMATPTIFNSDSAMQDCISRAEQQHESEFQSGKQVFGCSSNTDAQGDNGSVKQWSDDDFSNIILDVGVGNGGPSEPNLKNGHLIFETMEPVLNDEQCDYLIQMARETMQKERMMEQQQQALLGDMGESPDQRDGQRTNSELGEARLSHLPAEALDVLRSLLQEKLYPMLTDRFDVADLTVYDGLILGSIAPSISQPVHRDASLLTLNIALSSPDNFTGGGTYVEGLENHSGLPLCIERGKALCHSSGIMHAGTAITSGERWVMVLFVIAKEQVQIARRAHADGLYLLDSKLLNEAKIAFETGLSAAPNDHLLHMGTGQIASMRGDNQEAFDRLAKAAACYPASHRAAMTMGKMLEAKRQPRAALRQFDRVLSFVDNKDLLNGAWMPLKAQVWDARVSAGRCALLCAEYEAAKYNVHDRERTWSKENLPEAIERLQTALVAVPGNEYIESMLERAGDLLLDANEYSNN